MRMRWAGRGLAAMMGVVLATGLGAAAQAADPITTPSPTATPGPTTVASAAATPSPTSSTCTLPPVSGSVVGRTATSLTFSLGVSLACGYHPAFVAVYGSFEDAQMGQNRRGGALASTQAEAAALTVTGLTPSTPYWYRFSGGGSNFYSLVMGPTLTAAQPGCTATYQLDGSWDGGFVARVTVANASGHAISGWRVGWTWPAGQAVNSSWSAAVSSTDDSVTATNAGYNGAVAADGSTAFGFLGQGAAPATLSLTCTITS